MKKYTILLVLMFLSLVGVLSASTVHTFRNGDTLWALAAKHYQDPTLYPILLKVNKIDNPRTISVGTKIVIPNREQMLEIANEADSQKQETIIEKIVKLIFGNKNTPETPTTSTSERTIDSKNISLSNIFEGPGDPSKELIRVGQP